MSDENPYCGECGACGEAGCCPPEKCKYVDAYRGDYKALCDELDRALRRARACATHGPDGEVIMTCIHCGTADVGWMKTSDACSIKCRDLACGARMQCDDGNWAGLIERWNRQHRAAAEPETCDTADMPPLDAAAVGVWWHVQQAKHYCRSGNDQQAMGHATEAFRELGALVAAIHASAPKDT